MIKENLYNEEYEELLNKLNKADYVLIKEAK